jgi:sec-independent protein translocase protein TatA
MIQPLFIGTTELLLIAGLALLLFGGKKLPELMKGMGQGVRSFKEGVKDVSEPLKEVKREISEPVEEVKKEVSEAVKD